MEVSTHLNYFKYNALLSNNGWLAPAYVGIDQAGIVQYLADVPPVFPIAIESVNGFALPGFQNAHSHAFQFAMAGKAERHPLGTTDDFWSWREAMYACALAMDPDQMEVVATSLYATMLQNGYTHVAEFHYLHHDKAGKPYTNLAEIAERLLAAAHTAGIKITLVPVYYQTGNFDEPANPRQRRFISASLDEYWKLLQATSSVVSTTQDTSLGFGVHSLRAANAADILRLVEEGPIDKPFHIHAAEQQKEVADCQAFLGKRPIEWLLDNLPLTNRFHIVHATHMNDFEVERLAVSGANVVLCPGTEGNLGDGIFRLVDFYRCGGSWSIGTDSQINLNPLEDLRWLDYAQRLTTHKRNTFDDGATVLTTKTWRSGRLAMGSKNPPFIQVGHPLDAVVFDAEKPTLAQANVSNLLAAIVYTADSASILGTQVNGRWIVKRGIHHQQPEIHTQFKQAMLKSNLDW